MFKKNTLTSMMLLTLATSNMPIMAEQTSEEESEENVVVVTSRVPVPIREVATSVSVVTEQELIDRGYANLADALKVQPAIYVNNSGGIGSPTSLRIRGEEGFRTLVRIDGVDVTDPSAIQGIPLLGQLMSSNIDRVEILRGPQGLVYGADAGGVINITSGYVDEGLKGQVNVETGRYSTNNVVADVGYGTDTFDVYLAASDYQTDGFNALVSDASGDADGYDNTTIHSRLGFKLNEQFKLNLVIRDTNGEIEYDNCFNASFANSNDCLTSLEQQNIRASLDMQLASGNHQLAIIQTDITRDFFAENVFGFGFEGEMEGLEYLGNTQITDTTNLVYGVDHTTESFSSTFDAPAERDQTGYYFEFQSEPTANLFITAGARFDDTDDVGNHTSYRTSIAYITPSDMGEIKYRASYGTGFRAPSVYEVAYNAGPFGFPPATDAQLTEETSQGYEFGIELTRENGNSYQIVYFDQEVEDAIFFDLAGFSGYLQDEGTSFSKGIELIATIEVVEDFFLDANYTYNDTEDTAGERRLRRPEDITNIGVFYQVDKLTVSGYMRFVGGIIDAGMELDDYRVLDLNVRYQFTPEIEAYIRLENAFDEDYQDIATFNTPGASAYAGFRYQF